MSREGDLVQQKKPDIIFTDNLGAHSPQGGDVFENANDERIVVTGVERDGTVQFQEQLKKGVRANREILPRKPLENFLVLVGTRGMEKIDPIKEEYPEYYALYEEQMRKLAEAFVREFSTVGALIDNWGKSVEETADIELYERLYDAAEEIGKVWNTLDDRFVEQGRKRAQLFAELRSLEEELPESTQDVIVKMRKKNVAQDPDIESVEKGYLHIVLERRVEELQKKYDSARVGKIATSEGAPAPRAFVEQVNSLFATITGDTSSKDIQGVLNQLDTIEKSVFDKKDEKLEVSVVGNDTKNGQERERKGKQVKRFDESKESRRFASQAPPQTQGQENPVPVRIAKAQNILASPEVAPRDLFDAIQRIGNFLRKETEKISDTPEGQKRAEEIKALSEQAEQAHIAIIAGNDIESNKLVLRNMLGTLSGMLPHQENKPMGSKDIPVLENQQIGENFLDRGKQWITEMKASIAGMKSVDELKRLTNLYSDKKGKRRDFLLPEELRKSMVSKKTPADAKKAFNEELRGLKGVWQDQVVAVLFADPAIEPAFETFLQTSFHRLSDNTLHQDDFFELFLKRMDFSELDDVRGCRALRIKMSDYWDKYYPAAEEAAKNNKTRTRTPREKKEVVTGEPIKERKNSEYTQETATAELALLPAVIEEKRVWAAKCFTDQTTAGTVTQNQFDSFNRYLNGVLGQAQAAFERGNDGEKGGYKRVHFEFERVREAVFLPEKSGNNIESTPEQPSPSDQTKPPERVKKRRKRIPVAKPVDKDDAARAEQNRNGLSEEEREHLERLKAEETRGEEIKHEEKNRTYEDLEREIKTIKRKQCGSVVAEGLAPLVQYAEENKQDLRTVIEMLGTEKIAQSMQSSMTNLLPLEWSDDERSSFVLQFVQKEIDESLE